LPFAEYDDVPDIKLMVFCNSLVLKLE